MPGGRILAAAAGAAVLLACLTGALHSPFLLLVAPPLFLASLRLPVRNSPVLPPLASLLLLAAEGMMGQVSWWELAAAAAAAGLVASLAALARRWLREGVLADRAGLRLPAATRAAELGGEAAELERQVVHARSCSGAASVVLWEAVTGRARPVAAAGRPLPPTVMIDGDPLGWLAREGTPLRLERAPGWAEAGAQVIAARVWAGEGVAWLLTWEYPTGLTPPPHDDLARQSAPFATLLAALAMQREAAAGQQRLDALLALLKRIPAEIELAAYGRELLQAALALTGGTGGCVGSWSGDAGEVFARSGSDGGPAPGTSFAPPHSELALAVRAGTPIVRSGGWRPGETQVAAPSDEWLARPRTLVALPLLTPSGPVGAMALWSSRSTGLDPRALELLGAVLPYAALHLDHALAYGKMRERADRDALTGLPNRRAFDAAFLAERLRFERYGRTLAAMLIDIDHFKEVNDTYGHQTGDDVLRTLARVLESAVRDVDVPARFGGEEFVVLLPETELAAAAEVAERVRVAVQQTSFTAAGRPLEVHVSIGVAACPEQVASPQALLDSADGALYEAKRGGRNQVRLAQPAPRP